MNKSLSVGDQEPLGISSMSLADPPSQVHGESPDEKAGQQEQGRRPEREIIPGHAKAENWKVRDRLDQGRRHQRQGQ